MRWLVDECVDAARAVLLRELGHDVIYMSDVAPRATDTEVMARAYSDNRILLTEDKDFGDLVFRQARPVPGIVLLRINSARRSLKATRLRAAFDRFGETLFGRYMVIEEGSSARARCDHRCYELRSATHSRRGHALPSPPSLWLSPLPRMNPSA